MAALTLVTRRGKVPTRAARAFLRLLRQELGALASGDEQVA
jgi:hypothetical protein